uniref:Uncharacterized protein n=1 Tax=Ganoderma boninense TaxID=34458 RepID=A0A5K1K1C8_9APHY|nr:Uncharacterized protein [Ganoderma boninense]
MTVSKAEPREAVRAVNQRMQDGSPSGHVWKKLDRVVCRAEMLHALALRCPIGHVMLEHGDGKSLSCAADALRLHPVRRLKLTLACGRSMLDGIFTPELAGTLTRLTLCMVYGDTDARTENDDAAAPLQWDDLLRTTVSALQPLCNVTHIRVVVHCKVYRYPSPWSRGTNTSEDFMDSIRGPALDFDGAATALACALLSVQYVFLTTSGCFLYHEPEERGPWRMYERWDASRAWRVLNDEPGTGAAADGVQDRDGAPSTGAGRLVELHSDVADTIVRKEELVLSDADERLLFPTDDR